MEMARLASVLGESQEAVLFYDEVLRINPDNMVWCLAWPCANWPCCRGFFFFFFFFTQPLHAST